MSNQRRITVALLMRDTLQCLGLEWLLRQLTERPLVDHFSSFNEYGASQSESYDLLFIDSEIFVLHQQQLVAPNTRVVLLLRESPLYYESDKPFLHSQMEIEEMRERLISCIEESENALSNSLEKTLSQREVDVLKEVARGMTNKEIADRLNISMNTVMSHRKNITAKLNIRTVSGLTFYALMNGLISGEEVVKHASE